MKDNGRAAVVLDTGAVTRGSGSKNEDKERNIRKWFVEQDLIDGVILLPDNLFYNTTAAGIIIVLRKQKPKYRQGKITLINASAEFQKGPAQELHPGRENPQNRQRLQRRQRRGRLRQSHHNRRSRQKRLQSLAFALPLDRVHRHLPTRADTA